MRVPFTSLPDDARVWIFAATSALESAAKQALLDAVDEFLDGWKAHGETLTCAREWRDERFLVIGVDQSTAGASGCSIDGLFRILQRLQSETGAQLVGGGKVFFRDTQGVIQCTDHAGFSRLGADRRIDAGTPVFDPAITVAADYRSGFERSAGASWHAALLN